MSDTKETTKQTKAEKHAAQIMAIREDIFARTSIDTETGAVSTAEGDDLYTAHMPEGLSTETVKAVHDYNTAFAAATAGAVTAKATKAFGENDALQQVNYELGMYGKDKVSIMANRTNGLSVAITTTIVNHKAGALKSVFAEFDAAMAEIEKGDK